MLLKHNSKKQSYSRHKSRHVDFRVSVPFSKELLPLRYSAATLVINWLSSHEDPPLQRMAVAVSCLLVSKVRTARCLSLCFAGCSAHSAPLGR